MIWSISTETDHLDDMLTPFLKSLNPSQIYRLLCYCRDWNTNVNQFLLAQHVLNCLLTSHSFHNISSIPGTKEVLQAILAYSERHYQRLSKWSSRSFMLDCILESMGGVSRFAIASHKPDNGSFHLSSYYFQLNFLIRLSGLFRMNSSQPCSSHQVLLERILVINQKINQVLVQVDKDLETWNEYGSDIVQVNQVLRRYMRKLNIAQS
ncbi:uncharacterized protein Gasu_03800 [Galdieria sulphuraria]|uniref:U3 small nucleolar RNA-associated protein 13 C-terminal domain-containing protein n=1 Tax=Galdieria sulphuraria TaxID=130081 RepID=M2XQU5_GALSU|nr:uncharacterized protein Gasu_03800 [Galdieria sulphuraria]EME32612.1 hypothetical protein Gasu_03800 [Galdieria sulphuraria]|eukprot:XP_005709132.1 hypothetical protein Gasu_03800 [Galdieria sulphuraria]